MLNVEHIHEWRGQDVLDCDGERIGKLDEVFYDAGTGQAIFISVKSGLLGRRSHLVALAGATVGREHVRVAYPAEEVQRVEAREEDGYLDLPMVHGAAVAYGLEIGPDARFESATLITERHEQASKTAERADQLRQDALQRADDLAAVRGRADDAARDAEKAERELAEAQRVAEAADDEAHRAAENASPPPPGV